MLVISAQFALLIFRFIQPFAILSVVAIGILFGDRRTPRVRRPIDRGSEGLPFKVVLQEDLEVLPFVGIAAKGALSSQLF